MDARTGGAEGGPRARSPWPAPAWLAVAAALAMLAESLWDGRLLNDGDTYWHIAAGGWMLDHRLVPHTDVFSFTLAGAPWEAHEWLSEVVMATAYRLGGWSGLVTLFGLATGALALLLTRQLGRSLSGAALVLTVVFALICITPSLLARPHILALPLLVAWTGALLDARAKGRAPRPGALAVMLLWANMHGSFVFGFLILAAMAREALIAARPDVRWPVIRDWGLFGALALLAAAATPNGVMGLIFPFKLMTMTSLAGVEEWRPSNFTTFGPFEETLLVALFACLSLGVRLAPVRLLLLLILVHMALQHGRHVMILAMVGSLLLAGPLATASGRGEPARRAAGTSAWLALATAASVLIGARLSVPLVRPNGPFTPRAALDHVPPSLRLKPVLNDYGLGGYLIFRGVRPFVDGRIDLFGDAFMARFQRIIDPDPAELDRALERYDIAWTILAPGEGVTALMDAKPGWRRLYADRYAVVHVRSTAPPASSRSDPK